MLTLSNIANGSPMHRNFIIKNSGLLDRIRSCLTHTKVEVRHGAVTCVRQLAQGRPHQHRELREAGIELTLRHLCGSGRGASSLVPSSPSIGGHQMGIEEDMNVRNAARLALHALETPDEMDLELE